jgi:hypothetical protein
MKLKLLDDWTTSVLILLLTSQILDTSSTRESFLGFIASDAWQFYFLIVAVNNDQSAIIKFQFYYPQ